MNFFELLKCQLQLSMKEQKALRFYQKDLHLFSEDEKVWVNYLSISFDIQFRS